MDKELFEKRMRGMRNFCEGANLMPETVFARGQLADGSEFLTIYAGPTLTAEHIQEMRRALDAIAKGRGY